MSMGTCFGTSFIQTSLNDLRKYNYKNTQKLSYTHVMKRSNRLATLDYGQRSLVSNPFPNNKHQVIKYHMLKNNVTLK